MSMLRKSGDTYVLFVKGAPDSVVHQCSSFWIKGSRVPMEEGLRQKILAANTSLAKQGLRVLALAFRDENLSEKLDESNENQLTFIALVAMIDPPRIEAKEALAKCREAGIRPVMITGDHKDTGWAIAKELDMVEEGDIAVDGKELDRMSEGQLQADLDRITVYARVSAENKIRIIQGWKQHGAIVAMTGDGVNDAPAIKEADIGIAMGIKGSEVTKEASDMVITDDNFATIVNAVEEGRGIYDNIIKFVNYLLSSNIAEILVILFGILLGFTDSMGNSFVPLMPVQLLLLNLITDGFPAIALALDPLDPGAMRRPPRGPTESIVFSGSAIQLLLISVLVAAAALIVCQIGLKRDAVTAHTLTLTTLVALELVKVQMIRSRYNIGFFSNPWLIISLIGSFAFQVLVIYLPFFQEVFGTTPLKAEDWILIGSITLLVWLAGSLINTLFKKFRRQ
jgi:Ca2+-transporting ATPase